jgi:quinol-cytochrome oxidoreductase complex cytochrome b subunit
MWRGLHIRLIYNVVVWRRGGALFVLFIIISFLGYVLPWGQISFWGAAVIRNFFRVIPYVGGRLVF